MKAEITEEVSDKGVRYTELKISPDDEWDEPFFITFRKYPRRVFVAVEDYRDDQTNGYDLDDCWLSPTVIIEKTLREDFDPKKAFLNALKYLDSEYFKDGYEDVEKEIGKWMTK